jgi:hypothetical protein
LRSRSHLLLLAVILLLGAYLRSLYIDTPLLDHHRWRQVDTAAIARNLHEVRFSLLYPMIDWGGREGYVESEFPLLPAIVATFYQAFGVHEHYGRIVVAVFSTAMVAATFALAAELLGTSAGLGAALLVAVSPAAVFFGRTFMPDSVMLFFWVSGVFAFVRALRTGSRGWLVAGAVLATFACLVKIPAVMLFAPVAGAAWHYRRWGALRDRALLVAVAVPLLVTAAWYWHAYELFRQTGLTFGILIHPAKTYPPDISPGPWHYAFSKYSTFEMLGRSDFYLAMLQRLNFFHLLPWGLAGALAGAAIWKRSDARLVADMWLLAVLAFVAVMGEANISHEYYQLPMVPLAALYFGACVAPLFDRVSSLPRAFGAALICVVVGGLGFHFSNVVASHFRPNNLDIRMLQGGQAVQRAVPEGELVAVVDDYGVTSPMLLYYAHRKGWSFGVEDLSPALIENLKRHGARYFVTTTWSAIERDNRDTATYLGLFPRVELTDAPRDMAVFNVERPAGE